MRETRSNSEELITVKETIKRILSLGSQESMAMAAWRLPGDNKKHVVLSTNAAELDLVNLEELPSGFVISPFNRSEEKIFIPADYTFSLDENNLLPPQNQKEIASHAWLGSQPHPTPHPIKMKNDLPVTFKAEQPFFEQLVKSAIDEINKGVFEKVVLSRAKQWKLPPHFDEVDAFIKLCAEYPNVLVSLVVLPNMGVWLGATPETLVTVEDNEIFRTIALAGTQQLNKNSNLRSVAWTQKEIEEQALVERYIISCFKKIRLREYEEHGPKTVVAGNLIHLRSDFYVNMKETNFPQLGSVMLNLLHPTSAVCGVPQESAWEFIQSREGYDRQLYSGYLGPVNFNNLTHIFVNLRCMQIFKQDALIYAGAGITGDSVPENEWLETEMKLHTLLKVIQ